MKKNIVFDGKTHHTIYLNDGSIIKKVVFYKESWGLVWFNDLLDEQDYKLWEKHIEKVEVDRALYEVCVEFDPGFRKERWAEYVYVFANNGVEAYQIAEKTISLRFPKYSDIVMNVDKMES